MAMTLDDGPSSLTPGFLDALRDQDAAATFFMLGQSANAYPTLSVASRPKGTRSATTPGTTLPHRAHG
jgi:hypothetical protein